MKTIIITFNRINRRKNKDNNVDKNQEEENEKESPMECVKHGNSLTSMQTHMGNFQKNIKD